mmetsp:Transcript_19671/g.41129  ORF Transcript_19671/g.41129 Transcript_19671/m.41129 type:complete len:213 (+) Transcript_19671:6744-7382(+)
MIVPRGGDVGKAKDGISLRFQVPIVPPGKTYERLQCSFLQHLLHVAHVCGQVSDAHRRVPLAEEIRRRQSRNQGNKGTGCNNGSSVRVLGGEVRNRTDSLTLHVNALGTHYELQMLKDSSFYHQSLILNSLGNVRNYSAALMANLNVSRVAEVHQDIQPPSPNNANLVLLRQGKVTQGSRNFPLHLNGLRSSQLEEGSQTVQFNELGAALGR